MKEKKKSTWKLIIRTVVCFSVYIAAVVFIGMQTFLRADESGNVRISIYKEAPAAEADEGLPQEPESKEHATSGDAGETNDTKQQENTTEVVTTTETEITTEEAVTTEQETQRNTLTYTYNGETLADNGMPYAVKINRLKNIVTVYELDEDGYYSVPVRAMICSVSLDDTTPTGLFTTTKKRFEWAFLQGNVYGQYAYQIQDGIYFHSVPYVSQAHDALETWEYNKLGEGASLGCIRLCVADAKWIFENCLPGTLVCIFDSSYPGPLGSPQNPYKFTNVSETGWDPTDTAEGSPYEGSAAIYGAVSHSIKAGEPFDARTGVFAFSSERKDVTEQLNVEGRVDNRTPGKYKLIYSFQDGDREIKQAIYIQVTE